MSPYRFYQSWIGVEDAEVKKLLLQLTFLSVDEVDSLVQAHESDPGSRTGQRALAHELTSLVHGTRSADAAVQASEVLFGKGTNPGSVSKSALEFVSTEVPSSVYTTNDSTLIDLLIETSLVTSKGDAKRAFAEGSIYLNGERVLDAAAMVTPADFLHDQYLLLRRGKKKWHVIELSA
jgi:tyrosyl-tRNA synthetase